MSLNFVTGLPKPTKAMLPIPELGGHPNDEPTMVQFPGESTWQEYLESISSEWTRNRPRRFKPRAPPSGNRKAKWTDEEDRMLEAAVAAHGTKNWLTIAEEVPGRKGKQCRERWLTHMAPDINREAWSAREDALLVSKLLEHGRHWSKIREFLPGRSTSSVKNRWTWLCRRDVPNHWQEFQVLANMFPATETRQSESKETEEVGDFPDIVLPEVSIPIPAMSSWGSHAWVNGDIFAQSDESD
jgi:hypothetical protein